MLGRRNGVNCSGLIGGNGGKRVLSRCGGVIWTEGIGKACSILSYAVHLPYTQNGERSGRVVSSPWRERVK